METLAAQILYIISYLMVSNFFIIVYKIVFK